MIYLLFISFLFAHEDLPNIECLDSSKAEKTEKIHIMQTKEKSYTLNNISTRRIRNIGTPIVTDAFDPKLKQVFDTYTFKTKTDQIIVKRPETKGKIKDIMVYWGNKNYSCKKI